MGGTIHAVNKTTVYLPDELKLALKRAAAASGRSEAQVIREAIELVTSRAERPRPRGALFASGKPSIAENVDEYLAGFGER
ncbi:MAG: ribbon-helix-helix protein, CopG family [Solirubrobacteraceae bacterium]|jgi:plasmid stability protein